VSAKVIEIKPRKSGRPAMPVRLPNAKLRTRECLTTTEVQALIRAAGRRGRYGQRDTCLLLVAYRHGLRVSEVVNLKWDQMNTWPATYTSAA
jgi:site-specific recombinase XerD